MLKIQHIREGDTFYECEAGFNTEFVAISAPSYNATTKGWAITGRSVPGDRVVEFFASDKYPAYAPRLYAWPEYS